MNIYLIILYYNIFHLKSIFLAFWDANWLIKFLYSSSSNISFSINNITNLLIFIRTLSILDMILLILILKNFFLQKQL